MWLEPPITILNMIVAAQLGKFLHMRYYAHVPNPVPQQVLQQKLLALYMAQAQDRCQLQVEQCLQDGRQLATAATLFRWEDEKLNRRDNAEDVK